MKRLFKRGDKVKAGWRIVLLCGFISLFSSIVTITWKLLGLPPQKSNGVINVPSFVISGILVFWIVLLSIFITLKLTETRSLNSIGLTTSNWRLSILFGLAFGLLTPLVVVTIYVQTGNASIHFNTNLSIRDVFISTMPLLVFFVFQSGFEELLFRGYALQLFIEATGKYWAILLTGLLFGVAHSGNPGADIKGLLNTAANGILLALVVIETGSIILVWAYHASWNIFGSLVLGLNVSGIQLRGSIFQTTLHGSDWVTGGKYGFEASSITGLIETTTLIVLIILLKIHPIKEKGKNYFRPLLIHQNKMQ